MLFDQVYLWVGIDEKDTPAEWREIKFPIDISLERIAELSEKFDVAIVHVKQTQPSRKERGKGAKPVPPKLCLRLDELGGGFRCR